MSQARVLVVDDHRDMADGIAMVLGDLPLDVEVAYSAEDGETKLDEGEFALVLSDIRMPGVDGLELLARIRQRWPHTKVVMLTAHGSIDSAVEAMKRGATDYITKPFINADLLEVVQRAVATDGPLAFDVPNIVGEVAAAVSPDELLPSLTRAVSVLQLASGADDCELFLREPEGNDLVLTASAGPDTSALAERSRFELGVGFPGLVVSTGKPLCVQGDLADDRRFLRPGLPQAGIHSYVCVPLLAPGGAIGSLHLLSRRRDFPMELMVALLEKAAIPISNAVRAGLAALRQAIDIACGTIEGSASESGLRKLLDSMLIASGCHNGALALVDPATGRSERVIASGPTSTLCSVASAGTWRSCRNAVEGHGFAADPGRRQWPDACRRGLPPRMARPCCLPMVSQGRFHGVISLDFGRQNDVSAISRVVPLLTMANQAATRFEARRRGLGILESPTDDSVPCIASEHADLVIRCLGPFSVVQRGLETSAETFPRIKALSLLKMLALKAGVPINRDVLIERLWPDVDPQAGANRLHGVVHALRSVIEPHRAERRWIYVRNHGDVYTLDTHASLEVDVLCFRDHVERGLHAQQGDRAQAIGHLERAVKIYRGDLFEGDPYSEWCDDERRELREEHSSALRRLAQLHVDAGDHEAAVASLQRGLRFEPLRDDLHLALMELFSRLKRRTEAVAHYDDYERQLRSELGVAPAPELQALYGALKDPSQKKN